MNMNTVTLLLGIGMEANAAGIGIPTFRHAVSKSGTAAFRSRTGSSHSGLISASAFLFTLYRTVHCWHLNYFVTFG
jgi:hypothetical protein